MLLQLFDREDDDAAAAKMGSEPIQGDGRMEDLDPDY